MSIGSSSSSAQLLHSGVWAHQLGQFRFRLYCSITNPGHLLQLQQATASRLLLAFSFSGVAVHGHAAFVLKFHFFNRRFRAGKPVRAGAGWFRGRTSGTKIFLVSP